MRDGEEDAQQLAIRNLRRIVNDLNGFGVTSISGADNLVFRCFR
jgi:hypothetical protein